ncbi:glycosyltransferase family 4 protein [Egbenema bharatensis]|uniref:glycosyltransferase family 4 protein n=1 Tax=Egbenema bharatensis TaxID=3463334 RepID=UPI003A8A7150
MNIESNNSSKLNSVEPSVKSTIALLIWGEVIEDFLDSLEMSLEIFCKELPFGWLIGYIQSLKLVGVQTVLFVTSDRITAPLRFTHTSTGTIISVLPVPRSYRSIRSQMVHPYPTLANFGSLEELFGSVRGTHRFLFKALKHLAPYLSIPVRLLAKEVQREGCSAILCAEYEYSRFDTCIILGKFLRIPVFATFQGGNYDWNSIGHFLRPMTIQACSGLVIGSQTEIQRVYDCYHIPSNKIAKIFNPIDLRFWNAIDRCQARTTLNLPTNAQIVVWHGRVNIYNKGLDILLNAWSKICNERPDRQLYLLLIGTGLDNEKLRQQIAVLSIQNLLWIDKYVSDRAEIQCFLSASDIYAFPSRHEGFAVAPVEAMACGLPVVAARASGVPDVFEDGEESGGLVVPCGDPTAFAMALGRLLDNEQLRQELGRNARCRVEKAFSLDAVGKQLQGFLFQP